jgi:hypothetical protein
MPSKKKPLHLHVSRALIRREQADVILRTQRRIALLRANENWKENETDDKPVTVPGHSHNHYSLSMFCFCCFCVLLVIMNVLFSQWLSYQVRNAKEL